MNCPKCNSQRFIPFDSPEGVTVDFCRDCGSLWFEKGELAFYVETETDIPDVKAALKSGKSSELSCPSCAGPTQLIETTYLAGESLLIDLCPQCHGVFLDSKEIIHVEQIVRKNKLTKVSKILNELRQSGYQVVSVKPLKQK